MINFVQCAEGRVCMSWHGLKRLVEREEVYGECLQC